MTSAPTSPITREDRGGLLRGNSCRSSAVATTAAQGSRADASDQVPVKISRLRVAKSRCRVVWCIMPRPRPKPRLDMSTTCREKAYAELH